MRHALLLLAFIPLLLLGACGGGGGTSPANAPPLPAAPIGVIPTAGNTQVQLSWTAVAGATSYNVYYGTAAGVTTVNGIKIAGATSISVITGLANGITYFFVVTAVDANGESATSSEVSTTPVSPLGAWITKAPMIYQRDNAANAVLSGKIYVMGGAPAGTSILKSMEMYDPATDKWTTESPMPDARYSPAAAALNGAIYVMGGTNLVNGQGPIYPMAVYDSNTNSWSSTVPSTPATTSRGTVGQTLAPFPTGRWGFDVAVVDGLIYAIGGAVQDATGTNTYYGTVEVYDPVANTWTTKASMPTPRWGSTVSVINGLIYAIGGWGGWPELSIVEIYDPATDTWSSTIPTNTATTAAGTVGTALTAMPTARDDFGFAVVNGIIYAIGGDTGTFDDANRTPCCTNTVEAYNPVTNTWVRKTAMPTIRDDFDASVVDGVIYAIAGSRDGTFTNTTSQESTWLAANDGGYSLTTVQAFSTSSIPVPNGITATTGSNQATLNWHAVTGATSYNIYWSYKAGVSTTSGTKIVNGTSTAYTHTPLTPGTWYYYIVTAITPSGESPPSNEVAIKP